MNKSNSLYKTTLKNSDGVNGHSKIIYPETKDFEISSPTQKDKTGMNPEQFIGLALVTCLNATIEAEEKRRGIEHKSTVEADVNLIQVSDGFEFTIHAKIYMPHLNKDEANEILNIAEKRCPVAKLIGKNENVTFELV